MAFTGALKYFIATFILFACGSLNDPVLADDYRYMFLTAYRDDEFFTSELTQWEITTLKINFSNVTIHYNNLTATVYDPIERGVNIFGHYEEYRIYYYTPKPYPVEWVLEKKTPHEKNSLASSKEQDIRTNKVRVDRI